jgi:hypothetical protein
MNTDIEISITLFLLAVFIGVYPWLFPLVSNVLLCGMF